jgi:hypothetical protein
MIPSAERVVINACGAKIIITSGVITIQRDDMRTEVPYKRRADG